MHLALGVSKLGTISMLPTPSVEVGPVVAVTVPVTGEVGFILSGTGFLLSVSHLFVFSGRCGSPTFVHGCLPARGCIRPDMDADPGGEAVPPAVAGVSKLVCFSGRKSCFGGP